MNNTTREITTEWEDPYGWRIRVMTSRDMEGETFRYISVGNQPFDGTTDAQQFTDQITKAVAVLGRGRS